jgi:hypothetical protein
MLSNQKISAIYDLREAVESKMLAEQALDEQPSADTRAALLDATLQLEEMTQIAIDICHACGHAHDDDDETSHREAVQTEGNVISVDFQNDGNGRNRG